MAFTKRVGGGKDRFTWDEVKVDKDRENYLGHSLMAPVGRWQKGKDLQWYAKESQGKAAVTKKPPLDLELATIRQQEEEAMAVALGIRKPSASRLGSKSLTKQEIAEICKREVPDEDETPDEKNEIHRMQGLGYRNHRLAVLMSGNTVEKESLKGTGHQPTQAPVSAKTTAPSLPDRIAPRPPTSLTTEDNKERHSQKKKKKHKKISKHKSKKHSHSDSSSDERHKRKNKKVKKLKESKKRKRHDTDSD